MTKIVSIDFDGVLIEKVFGIDWKSQGKSRVMKNNLWFKVYRFVDATWAFINHKWRTPMPGSKEGLQKLKDKGYRLIFITSRQGYLRETTIGWLKKWGYFDLFDNFYFNDKLIGSMQSKVDNIGLVRPAVHIDDNLETVEELRKTYQELKVVWLYKQSEIKSWDDIEI